MVFLVYKDILIFGMMPNFEPGCKNEKAKAKAKTKKMEKVKTAAGCKSKL